MKDKDFKKVYWLSNPATSFAKEPDLNADSSGPMKKEVGAGINTIFAREVNRPKFVDYGEMNEFADAEDFEQFMEAEKNGEYEVEIYSPDAEKFITRKSGK